MKTAVTVIGPAILRLTFADGLSAQPNVLDRMRGPRFAHARTPDGFAQVTVDVETDTVAEHLLALWTWNFRRVP